MSAAKPTPDAPRLRSGTHLARRRRHPARADIAVGLLAAMAVVLLAPGLAIVAVVALLVIAACSASLLIDRRRSRRR